MPGSRRLGSWWRLAACQAHDPELFYPISELGPGRDQVAQAKAICAGCQVRRECLCFALETQQAHGVWGGLTEQERRTLHTPAAAARAVG
jgi:WhiB family redox-sensing transcriptional regulator